MKSMLILVAWLAVGVAGAATNGVVVANWNLENLFDTEDDPNNEGDDPYGPAGYEHWSPARYHLKLAHVAELIAKLAPDVLCVEEVENRHVLEDLTATLKKEQSYEMPYLFHRESDDVRGIDTAILSRFPAVTTAWLTATSGQRDSIVCVFKVGAGSFTVIGNHWKSQLGKKSESTALRKLEALKVREYLNDRLTRDPAAAIVVTGDFNDQVDSDVLMACAKFSLVRPEVLADPKGLLLYNLSGNLPMKARGTFYYAVGKKWNSFDSISVTPGMLEGAKVRSPWVVDEGTYAIFRYPPHVMRNGSPLPFRRVRSKATGDQYMTGYSDHFPVVVTLRPNR